MLTIVQAVGAMELVKKGVLVTKLESIEDAASIDVLCLDKTGTITQNKLSVTDSIPFSGYRKEDVIAIAASASKEEGMDLIDFAIIEYAFNLIDERMQMELNNKAKQHKEQVSQLLVLINACEVSEYTSELLADKENPLARLLMH